MILWYNAVTAFSSESVSAGNTELMHILANFEGVRPRHLRITALYSSYSGLDHRTLQCIFGIVHNLLKYIVSITANTCVKNSPFYF